MMGVLKTASWTIPRNESALLLSPSTYQLEINFCPLKIIKQVHAIPS